MNKSVCVFLFLITSVFLSIQDAEALGECDCEIIPTNMTVNRGERLEFDITVTNNTNEGGEVTFGGKIRRPDGTLTGWVNGVSEVYWIRASGEVSGHIAHMVPSWVPVGRYTYHGYVGNHAQIYGQCEFDFIVPVDLPKTGQTSCYDSDGYEIDCAGTGQDGDYRTGAPWPDPRFTDDGDGTVTDNLTGLIWLKNANCFGEETWNLAIRNCGLLNSGECGLSDGSVEGDWRLPNINELRSLVDHGNHDPALPSGHPFVNVMDGEYWSSSGYPAWEMGYRLTVDMANGRETSGAADVFGSVGEDLCAWPVRGGQ